MCSLGEDVWACVCASVGVCVGKGGGGGLEAGLRIASGKTEDIQHLPVCLPASLSILSGQMDSTNEQGLVFVSFLPRVKM